MARALLGDRGARAVSQLTLRLGRAAHPRRHGAALVGRASASSRAVIESARLNLVNARAQAEARGIALAVAPAIVAEQPHFVHVTVRSDGDEVDGRRRAAPGAQPRITCIDGFTVDVTPRRTMLVLTNADVPGVIGRVGTVLGDAGVNIAEYHQARTSQGGSAFAAITVDGDIDTAVRTRLLSTTDVRSVTVINFR